MLNDRRRTVTLTERGFDPPGIAAGQGQSVLVEFVNESDVPHVIEFDLAGGPVRLAEALGPGRRTFVRFVSQHSGVFAFRCADDARLRGALVVDQGANVVAGETSA